MQNPEAKNISYMNAISQFAIPTLTLGGQALIALKLPQWGLVAGLAAQPFWIYSTWKSYKQAGQIGILINTIFFSFITAAGIINYWMIK